MTLIRYFVVPVILTALAGPVLAYDNQWKVTFEDNGQARKKDKVDVVFTAVGCYGPMNCGRDFSGGQRNKIYHACKRTKDLKPGETTSYTYKGGTRNRKVWICSNPVVSSKVKLKMDSSRKKHTHICARPLGKWVLSGGKNCGTDTSQETTSSSQ